MRDTLAISIIQPNIVWESPAENLAEYERLIAGIAGEKEVVVLPEMFSTGFSMAPERLAEGMDGATVQWMKDMARKHRVILTGSLIIADGGKYYNRLVWMQPDGQYYTYDKRHLFGYAKEDEHYTAGDRKLIVQVKGWKVCAMVCYDLRFPVWARHAKGAEYDVLLYVANWPQRRSLAWKTLLQARAIENQCYVVGVNRVGEDGNGIIYSGDSSIFDPLGECALQITNEVAAGTVLLRREVLDEVRTKLPFLKDADRFIIPE